MGRLYVTKGILAYIPRKINIGEAEVIEEGKEIALWSLGNMVEEAKKIAKEIVLLVKLGPFQ